MVQSQSYSLQDLLFKLFKQSYRRDA